MRNIISNPYVGLVFLIPGLEETLRVNGAACIIRDESLLSKLEVNHQRPVLGIGVEVHECYIHCAKSLKRAHLWQPDTWPAPGLLPKPANILADHAKGTGMSVEDVAESLSESYTMRLY